MQNYNKLLDTIHTVGAVLQLDTTVMTEFGAITQSIWNAKEEKQIKQQLIGLLQLIPTPEDFKNAE